VWFGLVCLGIAARECWREFGVSVFSLCISLYQTFFSYKYNDTQFSCVFEKKIALRANVLYTRVE
jgi:hypothetical protein